MFAVGQYHHIEIRDVWQCDRDPDLDEGDGFASDEYFYLKFSMAHSTYHRGQILFSMPDRLLAQHPEGLAAVCDYIAMLKRFKNERTKDYVDRKLAMVNSRLEVFLGGDQGAARLKIARHLLFTELHQLEEAIATTEETLSQLKRRLAEVRDMLHRKKEERSIDTMIEMLKQMSIVALQSEHVERCVLKGTLPRGGGQPIGLPEPPICLGKRSVALDVLQASPQEPEKVDEAHSILQPEPPITQQLQPSEKLDSVSSRPKRRSANGYPLLNSTTILDPNITLPHKYNFFEPPHTGRPSLGQSKKKKEHLKRARAAASAKKHN